MNIFIQEFMLAKSTQVHTPEDNSKEITRDYDEVSPEVLLLKVRTTDLQPQR